MDKKAQLGKRIGEMRKRQGLSQERLAERAGISAQYVSNIERGKENPTLDLLLRLSEALRVSLGQMCDFDAVDEMDQRKMRGAAAEMLRKIDSEHLKIVLKLLKALT